MGPSQNCFPGRIIDGDGATDCKPCAIPVPVTVDGMVVTSAGKFQSLVPTRREMGSVLATPVPVGMVVPAR